MTVEQQTIATSLTSGAISGYFTLSFDTSNCNTCNIRNKHTSARISYKISALELETILENMPNIGDVEGSTQILLLTFFIDHRY